VTAIFYGSAPTNTNTAIDQAHGTCSLLVTCIKLHVTAEACHQYGNMALLLAQPWHNVYTKQWRRWEIITQFFSFNFQHWKWQQEANLCPTGMYYQQTRGLVGQSTNI